VCACTSQTPSTTARQCSSPRCSQAAYRRRTRRRRPRSTRRQRVCDFTRRTQTSSAAPCR
jgi:hypothetical protein